MRHLRGRVIATGLLILAVATACTSEAPDPGPRFDDESTATTTAGDLTCMKHQPAPPGARYTDKNQRRTDDTLVMFRYYTANAAKPYCDDKGPTSTDRAWLRLYVELGADRDNVAHLLDD